MKNEIDPVCRMQVDPTKAVSSEFAGRTFYFCCGGCKRAFDADPAKYAGDGMAHGDAVIPGRRSPVGAKHGEESPATSNAIDPVCGMTVDPAKTPWHSDHGGQTFHFCNPGCKAKFDADPERYLEKTAGIPRRAPRLRRSAGSE